MSAIEVYTKIMDAVKDADPKEAYTAMQFAQNDVNSKYYAVESAAKNLAYANQCGNAIGYPVDARAEAVAIVRSVVREELSKDVDTSNTDKKAA